MAEKLTTGQAAKIAGVDPSTIRRWCNTGRLITRRTPGGERRIDADDLAVATAVSLSEIKDEAVAPEHVIPHWASVSEAWGGWTVPAKLTEDQVARLRQAAHYAAEDLRRIEQACAEALSRR